MESIQDLENNRRLAAIEESISRTLLLNDDIKNRNRCINIISTRVIPIFLCLAAIIGIVVIVIIIMKKVN